MKILVAEDDRSCLRMLQTKLSSWGADVIVARSGVEAMRALDASRPPALAILGWSLNGTGGLDICRRLRERDHEPAPYVVVVLTPDHGPADLERGLEAGVDHYLSLPLDTSQLKLCYLTAERLTRLQKELDAARAEIRSRSSHDALTGLPNRATVREALEIELARSSRDGNSVGVLLADVDHLQRVNGAHGDAAGDAVLVEVARRMREALRPYDTAGRHDGEEFLVVLPGCEIEGAAAAAEHVREAFADPMEIEGEELRVTVSIGATASGGLDVPSLERLIGVADRALGAAKAAGRDRVVTERPTPGLAIGE
jgi:two-component system chemotaxis response regulator CheY